MLLDHLVSSFASRPAWTIREMSRALGYKSASSFARAIKRASGLSPKDLRSRTAQARSNGHSKTPKVHFPPKNKEK